MTLSMISNCVLYMMFAACSGKVADDETMRVSVIRGQDTHLPCGELVVVKLDDVVTWYKGDVVVKSNRTDDDHRAPKLVLQKVTIEDMGTYRCRVTMKEGPAKDHIVEVNVIVPPLNVSIRTDNNNDFEAGSPRVLACIVYGCVSSPNVTWYIGDTMLRPNVYKEVNKGNFTVSSLTFVPSLTDNGKDLVCKVTNEYMTENFEDRVTVRVGHRPICVGSDFKTIGAVEGESETLVCIVESTPEPEQFIWIFADGRTIYTSSKQKVIGHVNRYSSGLTWVPREDDFGPLHCRASNRFGEQKQPCTFSVIKGGPPATPECDTFWEQETLKIRCDKMWDGGRPQIIHLEVNGPKGTRKFSGKGQELNVNVNSLHPDDNVSAELYVSNSRGRSTSVQLILPPRPHQIPRIYPNMPEQNSHFSTNWTWTVIIGCMYAFFAAILVGCMISCLCLVCHRIKQRSERPSDRDGTFRRGEELPEIVGPDIIFHDYDYRAPSRLRQTNSCEYISPDLLSDCSDSVEETPRTVTFSAELPKRDDLVACNGLAIKYYNV